MLTIHKRDSQPTKSGIGSIKMNPKSFQNLKTPETLARSHPAFYTIHTHWRSYIPAEIFYISHSSVLRQRNSLTKPSRLSVNYLYNARPAIHMNSSDRQKRLCVQSNDELLIRQQAVDAWLTCPFFPDLISPWWTLKAILCSQLGLQVPVLSKRLSATMGRRRQGKTVKTEDSALS